MASRSFRAPRKSYKFRPPLLSWIKLDRVCLNHRVLIPHCFLSVTQWSNSVQALEIATIGCSDPISLLSSLFTKRRRDISKTDLITQFKTVRSRLLQLTLNNYLGTVKFIIVCILTTSFLRTWFIPWWRAYAWTNFTSATHVRISTINTSQIYAILIKK